jgi:hypothetical protein
MFYVRGAEKQVARANLGNLVFNPVAGSPGGNDVDFVAKVRDLWPVGWPGGEPEFQIAIDEHLGGTPRRSRQSKCGSERHWRRRVIHDLSSCKALNCL